MRLCYLLNYQHNYNYLTSTKVVHVVSKMLEEKNLPSDQVTAAAALITVSILHFLGISIPPQSSDFSGELITETGVDIIPDISLPSAVAKENLVKAVELASQEFLEENKTSMAAPIDDI